MTYLHPRDLDPDQPVLKDLSIIRKFKSYYNLSSTEEKLEHILTKYNMIPISRYLSNQDFKNLPIVRLNEF
jgi:hypothetical protein